MEDLELMRPYEPNVVKAAWNIFGDSYRYRRQYNRYKANRMLMDRQVDGQTNMFDLIDNEEELQDEV